MSSKYSGENPRGHQKKTRVKTAKRRSSSSTKWLQRQLNDPYVAEAKKLGYNSRAAFKIIQLDEMLKLFKPGYSVVDLGAAPGGWTQVAVEKIKPETTGGTIVALDYLEMPNVEGATIIQRDFTDNDVPELLKEALGGKANVVMSDMAPPTIGHKKTDHIRIMMLAEMAFDFAKDVLKEDGTFIAKLFQGGGEKELLTLMRQNFKTVKHIKPDSSRKDSAEMYIVGIGFKG